MRDETRDPSRAPSKAHRLEALGFLLAKQVITRDARTRERRDWGFRAAMVPLRELTGAHYQLLIDGVGRPEVKAKAPFDVVPDVEVTRTATWFMMRLLKGLDRVTETPAVH